MPGQGAAAGGQGGRDRLRLFTQDPVSRCRAWGRGKQGGLRFLHLPCASLCKMMLPYVLLYLNSRCGELANAEKCRGRSRSQTGFPGKADFPASSGIYCNHLASNYRGPYSEERGAVSIPLPPSSSPRLAEGWSMQLSNRLMQNCFSHH